MSAIPDSRTVAPLGPLPTGTVTFAFTDIEGSTQRWERDRAAMQAAVRRHDVLVRAAIVEHGGHVFKTMGDAFCAAFSRPEDAISAMLAAQRALAIEDFSAIDGLRIRAAIHIGTADERDGDYFGPTVNRVARLLAIAHGGQVIASAVAQDLAFCGLPPQVAFKDLGAHRLKDLSRPEQVYQLVAPDLRADFPALRSLSALRNNLPTELTSFIGRDREIAEITELLGHHRLVTLVGSGGVGKTRVSLQVAAHLLDGLGDGVWFIELAPLADGTLIPSTAAKALGITLPADKEPTPALVAALQSKTMLLVFDNCEHLVGAAAGVIAALLHGAPKVVILASSRQSLGIAGEEAYRMPSLSVPVDNDVAGLDAQRARDFGAITLFVERAISADKRFALTDDNAPIVADIVRRLDGIPLAIELAAPRVKVLDVRQLGKRLDERFRILTGGGRDVLPRQQTLRALIDWSHDLLDEREKTVFARLGIFVDGFTLEAAVAVCADGGLDEFELFDVLASLVDKSLVAAEPSAESTRYHLLESTRAYALEKLAAAGDRDRIAGLHLAWVQTMVTSAYELYEATLRETELAALGAEIGNLRAAIGWARESGAVDVGATIVGSVAHYAVSNFGSAAEWSEQLRYFIAALPDDRTATLARLWALDSDTTDTMHRVNEALQSGERSLIYARRSGQAHLMADALLQTGIALRRARRYEDSARMLDEAEALGTSSMTPRLFVVYYIARGVLDLSLGNLERALHGYELIIAKCRALGAPVRPAVVTNIAEIEHSRGNTERAITVARDGLRQSRERSPHTTLRFNLAGYLLAQDRVEEARREAIDCIGLLESDSITTAIPIEHLALAIALGGDLPRAARLIGYTSHRFAEAGVEREHTETVTYDRLRALLADGLAPNELARYEADGRAYSPSRARDEAIR